MVQPKEIKQVVLDGHSLTLEALVAIARFDAKVELAGPLLGDHRGHVPVEHVHQHLHQHRPHAAQAHAQRVGPQGHHAPHLLPAVGLAGAGEAFYGGERLPGREAMERAGIAVLDTLVCKEGLGITNGTCAMTSVGALHLYDTLQAARLADLISSLTLTALTGQLDAYQERMHTARGQVGQIQVARNMRLLTEGCEILERCQGDRVQDAYALRCIPQVHGAVRDALGYIKSRVDIELNAVTDNPLLFCEDEAVISGGNFHGEPMALPFDFLGIACAELASISERRLERMVNAALSNGLTRFLTTEGGVNSGFMIVQYTAASMASENKVLAHPACVDSIPSSANQEDFVSMGTTAARKAGTILENTRSVLAYELLTACQAIDIRRQIGRWGTGLSPVGEAVFRRVREKVDFMDFRDVIGGLCESNDVRAQISCLPAAAKRPYKVLFDPFSFKKKDVSLLTVLTRTPAPAPGQCPAAPRCGPWPPQPGCPARAPGPPP